MNPPAENTVLPPSANFTRPAAVIPLQDGPGVGTSEVVWATVKTSS